MRSFPSSFVFFEEGVTPDAYDVWYQADKAIVVARFRAHRWVQARNTQYGRGAFGHYRPSAAANH